MKDRKGHGSCNYLALPLHRTDRVDRDRHILIMSKNPHVFIMPKSPVPVPHHPWQRNISAARDSLLLGGGALWRE